MSKSFSDFPSEFQTFSNEIQKFTCEFQIFPNEIKIVLIMNRAPHRGNQSCQFEHVCHNPKEGTNCLSFWTVLPNVEPCGDNLEQNESSVKTANTSPQVQPPRVGEQWLAYVQELIDESMGLITYLYYNISRTIQLISVVLLWLFCYRLYVWFLLHCGIDM